MLMPNNLAAQTTQYAMGTVMTHKAFGENTRESLAAVCYEITRVEDLISQFRPYSDISRVNESAGYKNEKVSPEAFEVLDKALEFSRSCQGCFDVTIGPLSRLWKISRESAEGPDDPAIQQALALVNYRDLVLDRWEMAAGLKFPGQSIDPGGIGKGYAGDRILDIYKEFGVESAYSNLGGNVVTLGTKLDGTPWQIGIQHPRRENELIGAVAVAGHTVVTSGDYQRCFVDRAGKRHHHILNPKTGYPAESGLISVTIVAEKSLAADALSTIVFVAGMEHGLAILSKFSITGAVLIDSALNVFITRGLSDIFQAENGKQVTVLD